MFAEDQTGSGACYNFQNPPLSCPAYDLKVPSVEDGVDLGRLEASTPSLPHLLGREKWDDIPLGEDPLERK